MVIKIFASVFICHGRFQGFPIVNCYTVIKCSKSYMALKLYSFPSFYIFHIHKLCKSYEKLRIFKAILEVLKAEVVKMTVLRKLLIKLNGSDPLSEIPVG